MCGTNELLRASSSTPDLSAPGHNVLQERDAGGLKKDADALAEALLRSASQTRAAFERERAERESVLEAMRMLS
jgi:hypothetical protein